MKYQWKDNGFEQELNEDYFSWKLNDIFQEIFKPIQAHYKTIFETHYMLPHYFEQWEGMIESDYTTHAQFILRRDD